MRWIALPVVVLYCAVPAEGSAQASSAPEVSERSAVLRVHVGLWTTHLRDLGRGVESNWLLAVGWRGMVGGTFVNSFGSRGFAVGVERPWVRSDDGRVARGVGYRLGVVTGYDDRFLGLAGKLPLLPVAQIVGDVAVGPSGVELTWAGLVASMGPFLRFDR